jgi:lipopolysaccharide export system protein LptA
MSRFTTASIALGLVLMAANPVNAAPAPARNGPDASLDTSQPIAVNADSFLADLNGETGTYTGNVIVTQGRVKMRADSVKVLAPGGRASRMEAQGHVVVDSPSGQAVGDTGDYEITSRTLRLNGHVVLTKDANVMRGSTLEISMATGLAKLTGGVATSGAATTPSAPPGRVQGLFLPAQRPDAAPLGRGGTTPNP